MFRKIIRRRKSRAFSSKLFSPKQPTSEVHYGPESLEFFADQSALQRDHLAECFSLVEQDESQGADLQSENRLLPKPCVIAGNASECVAASLFNSDKAAGSMLWVHGRPRGSPIDNHVLTVTACHCDSESARKVEMRRSDVAAQSENIHNHMNPAERDDRRRYLVTVDETGRSQLQAMVSSISLSEFTPMQTMWNGNGCFMVMSTKVITKVITNPGVLENGIKVIEFAYGRIRISDDLKKPTVQCLDRTYQCFSLMHVVDTLSVSNRLTFLMNGWLELPTPANAMCATHDTIKILPAVLARGQKVLCVGISTVNFLRSPSSVAYIESGFVCGKIYRFHTPPLRQFLLGVHLNEKSVSPRVYFMVPIKHRYWCIVTEFLVNWYHLDDAMSIVFNQSSKVRLLVRNLMQMQEDSHRCGVLLNKGSLDFSNIMVNLDTLECRLVSLTYATYGGQGSDISSDEDCDHETTIQLDKLAFQKLISSLGWFQYIDDYGCGNRKSSN